MAITPESGKDGKVLISATSVGAVTGWTLTKTVNSHRYASSETAGYKKTILGVRSATGTITGLWDGALASTVADNTSATILLHLNASELYTVPCKITNYQITVDINDGNANAFSCNFESEGAWTEPTLS